MHVTTRGGGVPIAWVIAPHTTTTTTMAQKKCSGCASPTDFSSTQAKKSAAVRKCNRCVDKARRTACASRQCTQQLGRADGHVCARCGTAKYCSRACQKDDWRSGHKGACKARPECYICLESTPRPTHGGCACRGGAGYVHLACMTDLAKAGKAAYHNGWIVCNQCHQIFHGPIGIGLARAAVHHTDNCSVDAIHHLAFHEFENKDYAKAEALLRQVICTQTLVGVCTLTYVSMLGDIYAARGKAADAEATMLRVIDAATAKHGPGAKTTLMFEANYASFLCNGNKTAEAAAILARVLPPLIAQCGCNSRPVMHASRNLGITLFRLGRLAEAKEVVETVLAAAQLLYGEDHTFTKSLMSVMANL